MKKKKHLKKDYFTKKKAIELIKEAMKIAFLFLIITSSIIESSTVPTSSMEGTILVGDRMLINKFIYGSATPRYIPILDIKLPYFQLPSIREPQKNDIIVFEYPGDRDELFPEELTHYVKRCVAVQGDTIKIINKVVFINGKEFLIPAYIKYLSPITKSKKVIEENIFPKGSGWNGDNYGPYVIPSKGDEIILTIENIEKWRTIIDREFGERVVNVKGSKIIINGKVTNSYTLQKDYYFMMGDNRDNSLDSRYWGLVPRDKIVGQPIMCYWSWDSNIPFSQPFDLINSIRLNRIAKLIE